MFYYNSLNTLINLIITNYLHTSRCMLILSDAPNEIITLTNSNPFVHVKISNKTFENEVLFRSHGCQDIIIMSDDCVQVLENFEREIRKMSERFNSRRFLLVSTNDSEDFKNVFQAQLLKFIADLLVIVPEVSVEKVNNQFLDLRDKSVYELWTHAYVANDSNRLVLIDRWFSENSSFLYDNDLYPNKIDDQMGRILKVAAFTYLPYSVIGNETVESDGTEMMFAKTYAKKHNMTIELVVKEDEEWGEIYDNWTGYGVLGNMVLDRGDFGFSALYTWEHEHRFLDLSKPVVRTGITCLVPAPRLSAGWLMPLFSFSSTMWVAVGITFLVCALFHWVLPLGSNAASQKPKHKLVELEDSIFLVSSIFLLQSLAKTDLKSHFSGRYFILSVLLLSVFLTASYSSGLASSMTIPRYDNPINSVNDLAKSRLSWGATSTAWIVSIEQSKDEKYVTLVQRFQTLTNQQLASLANGRAFAFSIERLPFGHFAIGNYIQETNVNNYKLMEEDLYWEQCVFVARKNSVLLPSLDDLILRIGEAGLASRWETRVTTTYANAKVQKAVKYLATHHDKSADFSKLQWSQVEGAFGVLILGCLLATLCFVLEIIFVKIGSRKTLPFIH